MEVKDSEAQGRHREVGSEGSVEERYGLTGGIAPANQFRLSFAGSEDGEAETVTCRVAKPLWRKTNRTSGPQGLNLTEPPGAGPHAGWCDRGGWATVSSFRHLRGASLPLVAPLEPIRASGNERVA